jgi:hypothetical protein
VALLFTVLNAYSFYHFSRRQLVSLVGSVAVTLIWIGQTRVWAYCERYVRDDAIVPQWCPDVEFGSLVQRAKLVLGYISNATWFCYMIFCAVAIHRSRRMRRSTAGVGMAYF